jgi:S-DNA-T family DNA segregation ATPase FtsK/SpoIIIE
MQRGLPFVRPVGADLARDLDAILEDIGRIIRTYLDAETQSFEALPEQIQANERYEFIVAANFPAGYDRRTIEMLQKISKNGAVAGKYVFLQMSSEKDLPRDLHWDDFGDVLTIDADNPPLVKGMGKARMKTLRAPEGQSQKLVMSRLAAAKLPESNVQWSAITDGNSATWWTEDASTMIQAPVGSSGRDRLLNLWFGVNRDGRPCAHGILGAMPGSGKSNLYHVLVCGLAVRYGPEELNFYLIDGKMGVEFQPYRRLPHARVVALNSAPELSRSVLAELLAEMERRNEAFGKLGVVDLPGYRKLGSPLGPRPRIVLMIDEYQELFEDDRHNQASSQLLTLAQQGRSVGIHLLLGSQRFGAAGMLNQAAVFGSIHLRMAMRMSQADVQGLMEFGRNGKRLVEQCDLPGKIVINANSGDDNSNEFGKVALMNADERTAVIDALVAKADREWPAERRFATVVFDGREQPNFSENPQVLDLIRMPQRPTAAAWRKIATAPVHEQGFGVQDWYAGERPLALWLGQELNVHGQARIILRRRGMENVLFVGENLGSAYGMLAAILSSVALNEEPEGVRMWIADRALPETPWEGMIEMVRARVLSPLGYQTQRTNEPRQAMEWLGQWREELDRRTILAEDELQRQPTWLLALVGMDRIPQLARTTSNYGAAIDSPDGEKLKALYTRGPTLGLHVLLTFASASTLKQCLDRAQLEHFKHRVVTQMAEADSFLLLGNDQAAKLQRGETRPVFAICHDQTGGSTTKFKPYIVEPQISWSEQLQFVTQNLDRWKENSRVNG